jgi:hypothetical protein
MVTKSNHAYSHPSPPGPAKRSSGIGWPPLQRRRRCLLKGGLASEVIFTVFHIGSTCKVPNNDCLALRRSAREESDPQLPQESVELASASLLPSPPWPTRGGKQSSRATCIPKQQEQSWTLLAEIPEVEELTVSGHRSSTRRSHLLRMHQNWPNRSSALLKSTGKPP